MFDIVIVNWNSGVQLENCVQSILQCDNFKAYINTIIIVDNASSDGSMDFIKDMDLDIIKPVFNDQNEGFAKACNSGAAIASGGADYLLFLNPDTVLFSDTLQETVSCLDTSEKGTGIYGIRLCDETGKVSTTCSRFPTLLNYAMKALGLLALFPSLRKRGAHMTDFDHLEDRVVNQVMGAFYIVKKDIFNQLHGFDEQFFVYYEEVDLAYRAKIIGQKTYFFTKPSAVHIGCGTSAQVKDKRLFYNGFSRILYFKKHFNTFTFTLVLFMCLVIEPVTRTIQCLLKRDINGCKNIFMGYLLLYKHLFTKGLSF